MRGWQIRFLGSAFFAIGYIGLFHGPQVFDPFIRLSSPNFRSLAVESWKESSKSDSDPLLQQVFSFFHRSSNILEHSAETKGALCPIKSSFLSLSKSFVWILPKVLFPHDYWPRSGSSLLGTLMAASTVSYFYEPLYQPFANHHNCEVIIEDNMKQTF